MPAPTHAPPHDPARQADKAAVSKLVLQARPVDAGQPPTPAQQAFNRLLARVDRLTAQIDTTRAAADAHRPVYSASMDALQRQHVDLVHRLVAWLEQRLRAPGLTRSQQRQVTELIIQLNETPAGKGDGADLERLLRAAMLEQEAQVRQAETRRLARQAERQARKTVAGKPNPAVQEALDAHRLLRTLFRQLASALHPDRETDRAEHQRKSDLMSEVNTAYARRDLGALLRLQLRVELADPQAIARMADQQAGALSRLLKDRAATLEQELATVQAHARQEFGMAPFGGVDAATLSRSLLLQRQALQQQINQLHQDLLLVRDDARFKRWLRAQSAWA